MCMYGTRAQKHTVGDLAAVLVDGEMSLVVTLWRAGWLVLAVELWAVEFWVLFWARRVTPGDLCNISTSSSAANDDDCSLSSTAASISAAAAAAANLCKVYITIIRKPCYWNFLGNLIPTLFFKSVRKLWTFQFFRMTSYCRYNFRWVIIKKSSTSWSL